MKLYIDADACPVTDIALREASFRNIECTLICDTSHHIEKEGAVTITVSKGADSADFAIVNMISKGDLVITQDYGLAAMCMAKTAIVMNQNGMIYTDDNILSLLNQRYAAKRLRMAGGRTKGPQKRTKFQDEDFLKALVELFEKIN